VVCVLFPVFSRHKDRFVNLDVCCDVSSRRNILASRWWNSGEVFWVIETPLKTQFLSGGFYCICRYNLLFQNTKVNIFNIYVVSYEK
jgi:hypothetical protein